MSGVARSGATHDFERRAMGSPLRLSVVGAEPDVAAAAWRLVSDEFEASEEAMSRFRDSSDLTVVNRAAGTGRCIQVDRRLARALATADRARRITRGRFDARVLVDLERLGYAGVDVDIVGPDRAAPATEPSGSVGGWLTVDPRTATVGVVRPVDLGGIGKGLALRWAWRLVERTGLLSSGGGALLEAGGDLVAGGPAPQGGPWVIDIEDPAGGSLAVAVIAVPDGAVATSSVLVNRWTSVDGRAVHHLVDPRTGEPGGAGLLSVTVAGRDPAWAEVWSKSLFLYGAEGIAAVARGRGLAAWWVHEDGRLEMTAGARARTMWVAAEA
jgi:thiamine biosynthesis lipoprotein